MKKLFLLMVALLPLSWVVAQEQPAEDKGIKFLEGTYAEALQVAKEAGKPLFVDCYTQWCGPCKQLAKTTFKDAQVGEMFNSSFICLKLDMETPDGVAQKDKFGVSAYPTMVFVDPETEEVIHKMVGFCGAQEFLKRTTIGMSGNNIKNMTARYNAGERSDEFMLDYINVLSDANAKEQLAALVPSFLDDKCELMLTDRKIFSLFMSYIDDPYSKPYVYFLENKAKFIEAYNEMQVSMKERFTWNRWGLKFVKKNDDGSYTYDKEGMAAYKKYMESYKVKDIKKVELGAQMHYAECTGDWKTYLSCGDKMIAKYNADPLDVYNWALRIDKNCTDQKQRNHAAIWCDDMKALLEAEEAKAAAAAQGGARAMRMGPQPTHFATMASKLRNIEF